MKGEPLEKRVGRTIRDYSMIGEKAKVAVACSGGKDSATVLHILNELGYQPEALTVNLLMGEWSEKNQENLARFCKADNIPLHVISTREKLGFDMCHIRDTAKQKLGLGDCTTCSTIRNWLINKEVVKQDFDVVATGHNLDDEAQTVLMNILHGKPELSASLGPKTESVEGFVPRIKPLYLCLEREVEAYSRDQGFPVLYRPCPYSTNAYRKEVRLLLDRLEKENPGTKKAIIEKFFEISPKMKTKKEHKNLCSICGSPSRGDVCSACKIMEAVNG